MTRKAKREALDSFKLCVELWKIIKQFFPELIPLLKSTKDPRHQSYIEYKNHVVLFVRILGVVFQIESMRGITNELNRAVCFANISRMLGLEKELLELPHWKTINDYLKELNPTELEGIIPKLALRLTRMRSFENSRIRNKYWQIVLDGTQLHTFNEQHCEHCLVKEYKEKATGAIIRREYYHVVLEAKLVILDDVVISVATEFVENESPDVKKQDCELKAFYRLAKKLKARFPRLPICLGMDSLYAAGPVFDLCREYSWRYIIRFKDGSIKTVAEDFHALKDLEPSQAWTQKDGGITKTYKYVQKVPYQTHELNIAEYDESGQAYPFVFITDMPITKKNCGQLVSDGRRRWKIENEGFNEQKNHGYGLEHLFSENYTAMKNHYFLIQIGHMIVQLLEKGLRKIEALAQIPSKVLVANIKESFRTLVLNDDDEKNVMRQFQYRFQ